MKKPNAKSLERSLLDFETRNEAFRSGSFFNEFVYAHFAAYCVEIQNSTLISVVRGRRGLHRRRPDQTGQRSVKILLGNKLLTARIAQEHHRHFHGHGSKEPPKALEC